MKAKLDLDFEIVRECKEAAQHVAYGISKLLLEKTTVSIERTIARLLGINGVNVLDIPLANIVLDHIMENGGAQKGVAYWFGNAIIQTDKTPVEIAELVGSGKLDLFSLPRADTQLIHATIIMHCEKTLLQIKHSQLERQTFRKQLKNNPPPYAYVLTATGNIYEDVSHAIAVANAGGDIVAVIRSTAQSLLDYVPHGATIEGYGGTFATQENFRVMREALDDWSKNNGRYIMLSSFCSGLCMSEIAALGAMEGLDNMVNDALYGILYRDINMVRTLIDQNFSRMINGYFGIVINTGEDNYLRTADAIEAAPSVLASQMINYYLALQSGVPEPQIALGNAFEIHPAVTNGLLYEWAQTQLTRELFPNCPVKFMPPTKHMNGNLYRTHACDTLFNLITIATQQGIQTIGVPTEGVFTPHIHDRVLALENTRYVFNFARDLGDEIEFKKNGIIQNRASRVLQEAHEMLIKIAEMGLFKAIEQGMFGHVSRKIDGGKGAEGIVTIDLDYINPYIKLMKGETLYA